MAVIQENACSYSVALECTLKLPSCLPVRRIFFRGDVFCFLLTGKGVTREGWTFFLVSWPRNEGFSPYEV